MKIIIAAVFAFATYEFVVNIETEHVSASVTYSLTSDNVPIPTITVAPIDTVTISVGSKDYRATVLDKYFEIYHSPLAGYGSFMVEMCDKYNLPSDCTLIPAIAFTETKLCTKELSKAQNNCWGWGGSGDNRVVFDNFYQSIEAVSKGMAEGYRAYLKRPDLISRTYCGTDCENWPEAVISQQKAIKNLCKSMGLQEMGM